MHEERALAASKSELDTAHRATAMRLQLWDLHSLRVFAALAPAKQQIIQRFTFITPGFGGFVDTKSAFGLRDDVHVGMHHVSKCKHGGWREGDEEDGWSDQRKPQKLH